jgi:hypothetical protein
MDGACTIDEAGVVVRDYADEHPQDDLNALLTWAEWNAMKAEV